MSKNNKKNVFSEEKYRARMVKSKKGWLVKGMVFSSLLLGGTLISTENVQASEWEANSVETIKSKLTENQSSYTFEEGDTFYNIGLAVNVKWETLMEINGFEKGSEYTVPVGTTITFDGSKMTVKDKEGKVVNEVKLTNEDKVDPTKTFANQKSDRPSNNTGTSGNNTSNVNGNTQTKPDRKTENQKKEDAKKEAEEQKRKEEEAKKELERQKAEAEKKLTAELNKSNTDKLKELEVKKADIQQNIEKTQQVVNEQTQAVLVAQEKVNQAQLVVNDTQQAVADAQNRVSIAQTQVNQAQVELTNVEAEIQSLMGQTQDETIQAQLAELSIRQQKAQADLSTYQAELDSANAEVVSANAQVQAVNNSLQSAQTELTNASVALEKATTDLNNYQTELSNLPTNVEASNSEEAKKIQEELATLEAQIKKIDEKIAQLDAQLEEIDAQIKGVEIDADNSKEYAEKLKEKSDAVDVESTVPDRVKDEANNIKNELPEIGEVKPEIRHETKNIDEAGNELGSLDGYTLVSKGEPVLVVSEENRKIIHTYTTTNVYHKNANTDKHITINKDEKGNVIEGSLDGYELVSQGEAVKTVETLPNGDTITTYTTTNVYKLKEDVKPVERHETVNKDEAGNVITGSLDGYTLVSTGEPVLVITEENGKIIHTYTATNIYHKNVNTDKEVTINKDDKGNVIEGSLDGYDLVSKGEPVKTIKTLPNGDTVTTYTTTNVYKVKEDVKPIERHETVNKDEEGNIITGSLDGYTLVSTGEPVLVITEENGKIIHTYTTTNVYHKKVNTDKEVIINKDEAENVITGSLEGYTLVSKGEAVKTVETLPNGDTVTTYTTTNIYHKNVNIDKEVTINQDEAGNIITGSLDEYELVTKGEPIKTVEILSNGDTVTTYTTTNIYRRKSNNGGTANDLIKQNEDGRYEITPEAFKLAILEQINYERELAGLPPIQSNDLLIDFADSKANDAKITDENGEFSHADSELSKEIRDEIESSQPGFILNDDLAKFQSDFMNNDYDTKEEAEEAMHNQAYNVVSGSGGFMSDGHKYDILDPNAQSGSVGLTYTVTYVESPWEGEEDIAITTWYLSYVYLTEI